MYTSRNNETQQVKEKGNSAETVRSVARWTLFVAGVIAVVAHNIPNNFSPESTLNQNSDSVNVSQDNISHQP